MLIREALANDISAMHTIRTSVLQNVLPNPQYITPHDYELFINVRGKGWVCELSNAAVGFAIVDLIENNVWALFVLPTNEGKGVGRALHHKMLQWYFSQTTKTIWLGTADNTRAAQFYRKAGWQEVGTNGPKEIKFEMSYNDWYTSLQ